MKRRRIIYDRPLDPVQPTALSASSSVDTLQDAIPVLHPCPPRWVTELVPGSAETTSGSSVHVVRAGSFAWLSSVVRDASSLSPDLLRAAVAGVYTAVGRGLATTRTTALRLWNYLPDPGAQMGPALDRYMVFNAGRYDGYSAWLPAGAFERVLPTATAVGAAGDDLVVHCLASDTPGRAVQNPRQRQPWHYSPRYGPLPPAFSRGIVAGVGGRRMLLIGGTASIVGEDSVHLGDADAQLEETLVNLASVIAQALPAPEPLECRLARLTDLRVYVAPEADGLQIQSLLRRRCGDRARMEMHVARLCRPELLVEIEGLAELSASEPGQLHAS